MERHWTAEVGAANVAWITDPANFDGERVASDLGGGCIAIPEAGMDWFRDAGPLTGDTPGDTDWDDEHGLSMVFPFDEAGSPGPFGFWLLEQLGPVPQVA